VLSGAKRYLYLSFGWLSILLALIGVLLPIMPTTPFCIMAAYFFSRSSKKLHHWLLNLPSIGPFIDEWERHGVIRPEAKLLSLFTVFLIFSSTLIFAPVNKIIKLVVALSGLILALFIISRPPAPPVIYEGEYPWY
jgi:uncharacterized membrane protein YbaN (DUF454 family)